MDSQSDYIKLIFSQSKREEEREFYLKMAIKEKWGSRELERQFKNALFERTVLNPVKVSPAVRQIYPDKMAIKNGLMAALA